MQLVGRAALITGGKRIGAAVAQALAAAGMDVALSYNTSRAEAEAAAAGIMALRPPRARRQRGSRQSRRLPRARRRAPRPRSAGSTSSSTWRRSTSRRRSTRSTSRLGRGRSTSICAPRFCARARPCRTCGAGGGGRIINFADWIAASGRPRYPGYLPYYVAKAGVIALTEALALELAGDNILVNAIAPGPILAPPGTTDEELASRRSRDAARPLGWDRRDRPRRAVPDRDRVRDGRDDPRRRRTAREASGAARELRRCTVANSALIDSSAPVSSFRSRAKQKRSSPRRSRRSRRRARSRSGLA